MSDPRPAAEVEAQLSVQKLIRKAFREAKVAKQKAKEKARAARALAAKEQQAAVISAFSIGSRREEGGCALPLLRVLVPLRASIFSLSYWLIRRALAEDSPTEILHVCNRVFLGHRTGRCRDGADLTTI